jgi:hypothetical protein
MWCVAWQRSKAEVQQYAPTGMRVVHPGGGARMIGL